MNLTSINHANQNLLHSQRRFIFYQNQSQSQQKFVIRFVKIINYLLYSLKKTKRNRTETPFVHLNKSVITNGFIYIELP